MLCPYLLISIISFIDINKYGLNVKTAAHTFLWLWYSRLFGEGKTTCVNNDQWWGIGDVGLGAFGDDGTDISMVSRNRLWHVILISKNPLHFSPIFCESMFDDICRSVVHSLPESPFYLISHLTLSNHLMLGLPLFRTSPSSFFLRSALLCSSYARTSSESYIGLPLRFLPLSVPLSRILSFLILSTFVTSHIPRSNLFYWVFCNSPAPILPLSYTVPLG